VTHNIFMKFHSSDKQMRTAKRSILHSFPYRKLKGEKVEETA
jgi:hypothetical protein